MTDYTARNVLLKDSSGNYLIPYTEKADLSLGNLNSAGKAYVAIKGYDSTATYSLNEVVMTVVSGSVLFYRSLVNNNTSSLSDTTKWSEVSFGSGANTDLSNLSSTGEAHFANPSLSNLSAAGEAHFANPSLSNVIDEGRVRALGWGMPNYSQGSEVTSAVFASSGVGFTASKKGVCILRCINSVGQSVIYLYSGGSLKLQKNFNISGYGTTTGLLSLSMDVGDSVRIWQSVGTAGGDYWAMFYPFKGN